MEKLDITRGNCRPREKKTLQEAEGVLVHISFYVILVVLLPRHIAFVC